MQLGASPLLNHNSRQREKNRPNYVFSCFSLVLLAIVFFFFFSLSLSLSLFVSSNLWISGWFLFCSWPTQSQDAVKFFFSHCLARFCLSSSGAPKMVRSFCSASLCHFVSLEGWRGGHCQHRELVSVCSEVLSSIILASLAHLFLLMPLPAWDLYKCPRILAVASACLRSSTFTHVLVLAFWCQLGVQSRAVASLTTLLAPKLETPQSCIRRILMWFAWALLTFILSISSVFNQAGQWDLLRGCVHSQEQGLASQKGLGNFWRGLGNF